MKKGLELLVIFISVFTLLGCETVHDGTKKAGTYIGKGVNAAGGLTEGAVDGYVGEETNEENPFGR